ncbi:unnamed protein product [Euphydryas editha]|uniref:Smoothelin domain-containing protein n=1 Tax=Euphydryas editha TaxID=104508 RepID=A0AAU9UA79_EUPED|nr:unnamed protein product [Euphydryas editha]
MSEGDVSLIRDEDVLRRMWQQTEDFSRKKEIRTHMYRLREERLRNLYSPEPGADSKGCEFSSTQGHVKSFADQSFQSMKSKEVRDAGSPPKEFTYRGQDLKELSNAGWNVESENRTTDDGRTHVKSIHANIEGQYDVDGGRGQFAAVDHNKQAITEYDDGNTSLKRNENISNTAAHEQVVRKTDDGTQFSSTKSSSTSSSKFEQISSKRESVPYTNDNYDLSSEKSYDTNRNENMTSNRLTKTTEYEQNLRSDFDNGDVISRKVEYPDENTKVIVETRRLPDGTRVTSTRREFRAPAVQTSRSEQHSHQTKTESKSSYASTQQRSHTNESSSKTIRETIDNTKQDIVDSQKTIDDFEFKKHHDFDHSHNKVVEHDTMNNMNDLKRDTTIYDTNVDDNTRSEVFTSHIDENTRHHDISETQSTKNIKERVHNITHENVVVERKTSSDQYQSTYQSDFSQRKISNEWSPAHQAWASTLRSDTPTRPSTRASSPGSKTFKSSTSSLRSSVSPDKSHRKPSSRGGSPSKIERHSPSSTISEKHSSNYSSSTVTEKTSRLTSPDRRIQDTYRPRFSASPEKQNYPARGPSSSPDRKFRDSKSDDFRSKSPIKPNENISPRSNLSPDRKFKTSRTSSSPSDDMYTRSPSPKRQLPDSNRTKPYQEQDITVKDDETDMFPASPTKTKPSFESGRNQSPSPDRKIKQKLSSPTKSVSEPIQKVPKESSPSRKIPQGTRNEFDNLPGYMRPTAASKPIPIDDSYHRSSSSEPSNKIPKYHTSKSPERKIHESSINRVKEDHYKFIDEETKMYTKETNEVKIKTDFNIKENIESNQPPNERSPSPTKHSQKSPRSSPSRSPAKDVPNDYLSSKEKPHRPSSSPTRDVSPKNDSVSTSIINTNKSVSKSTVASTDYETRSQKHKSPSPDKSASPTRYTKYKDEPKSELPKKLDKTSTQDTPDRKSPDRIHNTPRQKSPEKKENVYSTSTDTTRSTTDKSSPHGRRPSPTKDTLLTIDNKKTTTTYETVDTDENTTCTKTTKTDNYRKDTTKESEEIAVVDKDFKEPNKQQREPSPSKIETYKNKHVKNDKTESTKESSPKAPNSNRTPSHASINKSPRSSTSPTKSPAKDNTYKLASDFINIEKTSEETNKNTLKDRPRQLITPSTSPTRKPKPEYAPSSGQSSPTTSVSGFEYFSHRPDKHIVTDLDEQFYTENTTDFMNYEKTTDIKSPLSSTIPCRSPSPERRPTKDSLPRKSSLKKPSNQVSPTEKPPTSFVVSPNLESKEFVDHKVIIKDYPNKENDKPVKPKPPFERRETYEERCRKILGMSETDSNETETVLKETTKIVKKSDSDIRSPSVSPCRSPAPDDNLTPKDTAEKILKVTKEDICLVSETVLDTKSTVSLDNISTIRKTSKIPSRETSPTKLQDITSEQRYHPKVDKFENDSKRLDSNSKTKTPYSNQSRNDIKSNRSSVSPEKNIPKSQIPEKVPQCTERKPEKISDNEKVDKFPKTRKENTSRPTSPEKRPIKTSVTSSECEQKHSTEHFIHENISKIEVKDVTDNVKPRSSVSPSRQVPKKSTSPARDTNDNMTFDPFSSNKTYDYSTEFITSEKEKEVLDRVQKSLRKLSPDRKQKSPIQEDKLPKSTTLRDLEIVSKTDDTEEVITENITQITNKKVVDEEITLSEKAKVEKSKDQKVSSKPPSRNVSPTKKASNTSPVPARSISPKKPLSPTERPHSPQVPKASGIKPREQLSSHLRKPSPTSSATKTDKNITPDVKKITPMNKQFSNIKTSNNKIPNYKVSPGTIHKIDQEPKGTLISKSIKENVKKDSETKVTRTASDIALKSKNTLPQKIRSKPEIQVNDVKTNKITKQTTTTNKLQKTSPKDHQTKLPTSKNKSATALNTSTDEDDVIIDVQQAKSSRENSPDRICPTPVGNSEDVGIPRFPDEVKEPDDEHQKRNYQTIHETESIVDDIVEISEDEELFVKRTNVEHLLEEDDSLLSVNSKVSKFTTKIEDVSKPKDTTAKFKEIERKVHSDFIDENLKSDDCLLSVSEKVNKFAKGHIDRKGNRSPSRNIVEEFDKHTTYQDDYTKLSVNDKAHLFIETAENVKSAKTKPAQKIDRPDFHDIDDELKTDDCLLSVSDKVNKFVKTAEQFLSETQEIEEKEKKIKEQHDKIMRKIVENVDVTLSSTKTDNRQEDIETVSKTKPNVDESVRRRSFDKETPSSNIKAKDFISPNVKSNEKPSTIKITTLRSNEAVKKAKALFENIATTTPRKTNETPHLKTSKLTDKMLTNKSPKIDSIKIQHHSLDNDHKVVDDDEKKEKCFPIKIKREPSDKIIVNKKSVISHEESPRSSPTPSRLRSPDNVKAKSPSRNVMEFNTTTTHIHTATDLPKKDNHELDKHEKPQDKIPGYQRPTKTSQNKEEIKMSEETDVSSRRGSGKFGVELRRTSTERSTVSTERRRSSVEHHQPCIEDIFDLDLLEQMLEKVVGYEQRRRIRAQIRVAKKKVEKGQIETNTVTKTKHAISKITKTRSPERIHKSPERQNKSTTTATTTPTITTTITQKSTSPERHPKSMPQKCLSPERDVKSPLQRTLSSDYGEPKEDKPLFNGHVKDTIHLPEKQLRSRTPDKLTPKAATKSKSPVRPHSPDKKSRPISPNKTPSMKPKSNRFNEYASAYMKKVGLKESEKVTDIKSKKVPIDDVKTKKVETHHTIETKLSSTTKKTERISSKDTIEITQQNGKRSPSPKVDKSHTVQRKISPERKVHSPERKHVSPERSNRNNERLQHSPERAAYSPEPTKHIPERAKQTPERDHRSPERVKHDFERPQHSPARKHESPERVPNLDTNHQKSNVIKSRTNKETIIKTVYDIEKKIPLKQKQEEKPSWVTNRNLKKITTESRTVSTKKIEPEKPKYRQVSPSKVITKPIDVITSSYGPGPLDTDGKPLFGIKALRNGSSNFQVKGTVIRQEFHSRNGGEPEGTVSVTAYSTEPEDLEKLLQAQGEKPSRLHGLAAITTTKKFGGDTGTTLSEVHNKEERATLDQFTHSDRRVIESRITSGSSSLDRREQKFTQKNRVVEIDHEDSLDQEDRSERIVDTDVKHISDVKTETSERLNKHSNKMQKEKFERNVEIEKRGKEKSEKRLEERKTVRQNSVKSLTEKFIKNASETSKSERHVYPKAGLILRTTTVKDNVSCDSSAHAGVTRTDSEHSLGSDEEVMTTTTTEQAGDGVTTTTTTTTRVGHARGQERSFLDSTTKVTGVQDILTRMKNADIVIEEGDSGADAEARALLNKFLGASVLMAGMQSYVTEKPSGKVVIKQVSERHLHPVTSVYEYILH